jgi:hypothetical protein
LAGVGDPVSELGCIELHEFNQLNDALTYGCRKLGVRWKSWKAAELAIAAERAQRGLIGYVPWISKASSLSRNKKPREMGFFVG